ncbi:MAG: 2-C-methyl-D-erythritol 4-phosphate cytidylyltransferase [Selenomonadaceae bacterium]|nr:2-C-methyl-D-erythritol 4-phosphate cytidylyltransferase [Selenomonadaceae bacterium]
MSTYALLTAGGTGNRMGQDIPKQFMPVDNVPVIIYTMQAFQNHPDIDGICVPCLAGWEVALQSFANQYGITKLKWICPGGTSNQESIFNGLKTLKEAGCDDEDIVLVHDGVRPLVSQEIISNNIETCKRYRYAVTGLVCKEAIMRLGENVVQKLGIPREALIRTQTPHTYHLGDLLEAHRQAGRKGITNTVASCTLMAELGISDQHWVMGSEKNGLKLTKPEDVELFLALKKTEGLPWLKS